MKKALTLFLAALMLCSCATFTVSGSSSTDSENFAIVPVSDMDSDIGWSGSAVLDTANPYQGTASRSVTFEQVNTAGDIKFQFDHPTQTYDISAMKYLYFDLYLSDASVFADKTFELELRSPNGNDDHESRINQKLSAFLLGEPKDGWNRARVELSSSSMKTVGNYSDKEWVYLRFFNAANETIGTEGTSSVIKMDNVYFASADRDTATTPSVEIKGASLELSDSFGIVFDVEAKSCVPVMEIESGLYEQGILNDKGYYSYDYSSIYAHLLADTLYPTFIYVDGNGKLSKYTYSEGYSVKQYCINMLEKIEKNDSSLLMYSDASKAALKRLLSDTLYYGAAAQTYASYNTTDNGLATDGVDNILSSQVYTTPTEYVTMPLCGQEGVNGSCKWHGVSLVLGSAMRIRYYLTGTSPVTVIYGDHDTSRKLTSASFSSMKDSDGKTLYYFDVPVNADSYDEVITAYFDGNVASRVVYSVNTYIKNKCKEDCSALSELLKAINNYGNSAKAYVAAKDEDTMTYYKFTEADKKLYEDSYDAFVERVTESGYAPTSVTGAYAGEFVRDASCQLLSHIANDDAEVAKRMLQYVIAYHKADGNPYFRHIIDNLQTDATYDYLGDSGSSSSANLSTYYQEKHGTELFGIKKDTNACAQKFSVPSDKITGISVYLKSIPSDGQLVLELSETAPANGKTISFANKMASVTLNCADIKDKDGWTTFQFASPVSVTANQNYYFSIHIEDTESKARAFGIEFSAGLGTAFNFDTNLGGWYGQHNKASLAFAIMTPERQSISETHLFGIKENANACAQQFSVSDDNILGISVYLKSIPSDGQLVLELSETAPANGKTISFANKMASVTLNCKDIKTKDGWTTFQFASPVSVTANKDYYFSLHLENSSGTATAFGLIAAPGTAFNYDFEYQGGWKGQHNNFHLAYEILTPQCELLFKDENMPTMGMHTINQKDGDVSSGGGGSSFVATSEYVSAIDVYLNNAAAATNGTVWLWLGDVEPSGNDRSNPFASGHELAKVEVSLSDISGSDWVRFNLATPVWTTVGETYYFVVSASSDTTATIMTVGCSGWWLDQGEQYKDNKIEEGMDNALTFENGWKLHKKNSIAHRIYGAAATAPAPDPYTSSVTIGGETVAVQTVDSSQNGKYVTCAELRLARAVDAADNDTYTVSLYKGNVLVDELTRKLSTLTTDSTVVHFNFCLPIKDTAAGDSYTVRVSASKANSVKWFGIEGADTTHAATLGGTAQDIQLSLALGSIYKVDVMDQKIQVDGNYMMLNAYAMFALKYYDKYTEFIQDTYPLMKEYADYFFDSSNTYERKKWNNDKSALVKEGDHKYFGEDGYGTLLLNPCCEHAREGSYWEGYDLITNVFAAEATYKMGQLASKLGESDDCNTFIDRADKLSADINKYMIQDFNGKKIYVEMYAISNYFGDKFVDRKSEDGEPTLYYGFSYLSMSPAAADWYKTDWDVMNNTYEAYMEHAAEVYATASDGSRHIIRPSVCTLDENNRTVGLHNHISGKDFSWELYYLYKTGNEERLAHLMDFLAKMSVEGYYAENYNRSGGRADVGNQEQTGWLIYEIARITGICKD